MAGSPSCVVCGKELDPRTDTHTFESPGGLLEHYCTEHCPRCTPRKAATA